MNRRKQRIVQLASALMLIFTLMAVGVMRLPAQRVGTVVNAPVAGPSVAWPTSGALADGSQVSGIVSSQSQGLNRSTVAYPATGYAYEERPLTYDARPLPQEWPATSQEVQPTPGTTELERSHPVPPEPQPTIALPTPQTNPFVDSAQDRLSTFALEVDTGAYTAARNYILAGNLPPAGMVRVEEFVNYFRYDYPVPEDKPFSISVDSAVSPFTPNTHLVRVGIQAQRIPDESRKSAVLTFVIDVSGSMAEPNRLPLVKQALRLLVNELRPIDKVGIVVYGSEARLVLDHTSLQDRNQILAAIDLLQNEGSTNAEAGLKMGYELASKGFDADSINRVILCSDGVANVGATTPDDILNAISQYSDQGVYLTTVGFGMGDYNDHLMEQLADSGDGQYAYVDNLSAAKRVFVENLSGTLQVVAKDAKAQVDFDPARVAKYRLVGYENRDVADDDFRNDAVDAGEIGAGHTVTALYEIELASTNVSTDGDLLTVQVRYLDPKTGQATEIAQPLRQAQLGASLESATPRFQLAAAAAGFAEILKGSQFVDDQTAREILVIAERLAGEMPRDGDVQEFAALVKKAAALR